MSALQVFEYTGRKVRTVTIDGDPWFVARDVCGVLDIGNPSQALSYLDDDERGLTTNETPGGQQQLAIINESGLYSLILRSRKPEAKAFKRWVTHEVLPSIRRTGQYGAAPIPQSFADALELAAKQQREIEAAEARRALDAPKVESFDAFMDAEGHYTMEAVAKSLADVTGGLGRNKLFARLRADGILMSTNTPYQRYARWFKVVPRTYTTPDGQTHTTKTTFVRPAGIDGLRRHFDQGSP